MKYGSRIAATDLGLYQGFAVPAPSEMEAIMRRKEVLRVDDAKADGGWRKTDMALLGKVATALHLKKIDELDQVNQTREMAAARDLEDQGLVSSDADDEQVAEFHRSWVARWSGNYGSFDDITIIDPMRFTYDPPPPSARPCNTLQVYSVRVAATRGVLQWPLHVFGMVAVRDSVDRNRNLVFYRTRDDCQTLTEKDQCLVLSGPSRAIVLSDPVTIEVELHVKGNAETEDKDLSLLALPFTSSGGSGSCSFEYTSKLSTLEFMLGEIVSSVEATIFVRVADGKWPDGFHGHFAARTSSIDQDKVILLDFGDGNVTVSADGIVKLSRHVVSVDVSGKLKVSFKAWQDDCCKVVEGEVAFTPAKAGRSFGTLRFGSCRMEVLVAWSLISPEPEPDY